MEGDNKFLREKYGLKDTVKAAFSDKTARKKQLDWWINREHELREWKRILRQSITLERNYIVFVIGSYGRGKTLSLLKAVDEAEKFQEICVSYLNFKGEERSKPGLDFLFRIFKSVDLLTLGTNRTADEIADSIERIPKALEEPKSILKRIYFGEAPQYRQKTLVKAPAQTRKTERGNLALYFLRGEVRPTTSQLKELGVVRRIDNIDVAKEYLAALLCYLRNLGYRTLFFAIDEFEYLFSLVPRSQQGIYIALLRSLYDFPVGSVLGPSDMANMVFFIAISEDGWNGLKEMERRETSVGGPTVPLMERVDAATTLGVFDKKQARELIVKRLRFNRVEGMFEKLPLLPFSEDFVTYIYEETGGEPRAIVARCGQVLDAGLAERVPLLTRRFAQRILEERGF